MERGAEIFVGTGSVIEISAGGRFAGQVGDDAPACRRLAIGFEGERVAEGDDELAFAEGCDVGECDWGEAARIGGSLTARSPRRARRWVNGEDGQSAAWVGGADFRGIRFAV